MNTGAPWSVKGVDPDARETAKSAARDAGLTLGAWLNSVILARGEGDEPFTLSDEAPRRSGGSGALEALNNSVRRVLDQVAASDDRSSLSFEKIHQIVNDLLVGLERAQETMASAEIDQRADLSGVKRGMLDLATRVSLMESSSKGGVEASAIQALEEAITKIADFLETSDRRRAESIAAIEKTLNRLSEYVRAAETRIGQDIETLAGSVSQLESRTDGQLKAQSTQMTGLRRAVDEIRVELETEKSGRAEAHSWTEGRLNDLHKKTETLDRRIGTGGRAGSQELIERLEDIVQNIDRVRERVRAVERRQTEDVDSPVAAVEVALDRLAKRCEALEGDVSVFRSNAERSSTSDAQTKEALVAMRKAIEDIANRISALERQPSNDTSVDRQEEQPNPKDTGRQSRRRKPLSKSNKDDQKTDRDEETEAAEAKPSQVEDKAEETDDVTPGKTRPFLSPRGFDEDIEEFEERPRIFRALFTTALIVFIIAGVYTLGSRGPDQWLEDGRPDLFNSFFELIDRFLGNAKSASKLPIEYLSQPSKENLSKAHDILGKARREINRAENQVELINAIKRVEQSARLGLPSAQFEIGGYYEFGFGVKRDVTRAQGWYRLAASKGHASAMHNLAVLLAEDDRGAEASAWFAQAAHRGVISAQYNLAILHETGLIPDADPLMAYCWYAIAAQSGDVDARKRLAIIAATMNDEERNAVRRRFANAIMSIAETVANKSIPLTVDATDL
jgi:localization factor PodJL